MAVPRGVLTVTWPEPVFGATDVVSVVAVAAVTPATVVLKAVRLFAISVSKSVPVTVTAVPGTATAGDNPVMVGPLTPAPTTNAEPLVADPAGAVTAIVPVVAPTGTVTVSVVVVAAEIVAVVPLNVTVSCDGVAENPVPAMVTVVPAGPLLGETEMMDT
jgi:hypothetical protein